MPTELKLKDKKLIYELDFQARMSLTKIAKRIGVSKQVAKYNLERLEKEDIIQGFYADINSSKLGYAIYLVYLKFSHMSQSVYEEFLQHVSKKEGVGVNATIYGKWDHCLGIWAKTVMQFRKRYLSVIGKYEQYVQSKVITIETDFYYFKPKQILQGNDEQISMIGDIQEAYLDEKNKDILIALANNARMPFIDIAKKIHASANGVKERIKKLEKEKIILGYRVMINYQALGFMHYRVFLHLENSSEELEKQIIQFLKLQKEVVSVTKTIGYGDLEFRAIVKNLDEYYELMKRLRTQFSDQIKDIEFITYQKFHEALNYFPFFK
ncbi:winged helix-turn-helix transcriptional regulator [Candidatus Woesearchaeota archaeon]|nr:MAG: winged helix-turn-helix transcriptional regulator [Candidatus Woesearchaeota archaeon]